MITDPFKSEAPAVSPKFNIIAAGDENPKVCVGSCEG